MDIHPLGYAVKQATLSNKPLPFSLVFSNSKDPRKNNFLSPIYIFWIFDYIGIRTGKK